MTERGRVTPDVVPDQDHVTPDAVLNQDHVTPGVVPDQGHGHVAMTPTIRGEDAPRLDLEVVEVEAGLVRGNDIRGNVVADHDQEKS